MKLVMDFSNFKPWSGAVETWERIEEAGKVDELEFILDGVYPDSDSMSDTELNDLLWFEPETVFEWLGIEDEDDEEEEEENE